MSWRGGALGDLHQVCLEFVNAKHIELHPAGTVNIEEKRGAGKGIVSLETSSFALRILPDNDNHPIAWYCENKCADGAVVIQTDTGFHVAVIEIKSKLSVSQWEKARKQLRGMLVNTLATMGGLSLESPVKVTCYVAIISEHVSTYLAKSLGANKRPLGSGAPSIDSLQQSLADFRSMNLTLPDGATVPVNLIQRDDRGNATIALPS